MKHKFFKKIVTGLAVFLLTISLFVAAPAQAACAAPVLMVRYQITNLNRDGGAWKTSTVAEPGDTLQFTIEMHNTTVGENAIQPSVRAAISPGAFTNGNSMVVFWASNAAQVNSTVQIQNTQAATVDFISGSARLTWPSHGFNDTPIDDSVGGGGFGLPGGVMEGCNQFIAQITFRARVSGNATTPPAVAVPNTPTTQQAQAAPSQSSTNNNTNNNTNTNTNNNNINIGGTTTAQVPVQTTPTVVFSRPVTKQPDTGVDALGMASMFGAGPVGFALSRYGKGKLSGKKEETIEEMASNIARSRQLKTSN